MIVVINKLSPDELFEGNAAQLDGLGVVLEIFPARKRKCNCRMLLT